jgi:uncharacterized protein (DUF305 family)
LETLLSKAWLLALLVAVAFIPAACGGAGSDQQGSGSGGGMAGMDHDQMGHDSMVPHHQGAIAMANVALENAEHEEIKELSRNIVSTQHAEIEELKAIKKEEFGTSEVPMEMSSKQMRDMGMMMDPQALADENPFDQAFIDAMIPHHRSAIEMAKVANQESENPRIKELAGNIVSDQKGEIEQMRRWRELWYQEG